jgi:hypothetical protein
MLLHRAPFVLTFSSTMASHQICNMDLTPNPVQNRQLMLLCPQVDPARQQQYSWWTNNATSCCTAGRQLVRCWIIYPREKHEFTWPQKERHCSSSAPQCSVRWEGDRHSKKSIVAAAAAGVVSFDGLNVPVLDTNLGPKKKGEKVQISCPRTCRSIDKQLQLLTESSVASNQACRFAVTRFVQIFLSSSPSAAGDPPVAKQSLRCLSNQM